jgi:hypothetical protein
MNHCTYRIRNLQLHTCTYSFFSLLNHLPKLNQRLGNMHSLKNFFTLMCHPTCPLILFLFFFVDLIRMVRCSQVKCILLKVGRNEFLKDLSLVLKHKLTEIPVHVAAILSQNLQNIDPDHKCKNTTNIM